MRDQAGAAMWLSPIVRRSVDMCICPLCLVQGGFRTTVTLFGLCKLESAIERKLRQCNVVIHAPNINLSLVGDEAPVGGDVSVEFMQSLSRLPPVVAHDRFFIPIAV